MFTVLTEYGSYKNCSYEVNCYANKHIAVQIYCEEGPLAMLTTNVPGIEFFPEECSCLDTNNFPEGPELVKKLGIAEPTGNYIQSGWCNYPVYKFNIEV